jgi:hypothetical protein
MATRARHADRLGENKVIVEIDAYAVPDFVLALTPEQARVLAEQLMRPSGRMERTFRRSGHWLSRLVQRRS